jgi:hypothetical protein
MFITNGDGTMTSTRRFRTIATRILAAAGLCIALSGCIVVPAGHPYYHPYRYYY